MRGFTMIEMMVVIGVIAILALMAMPNYSERIIRDQIVEALPLADIAKPPVQVRWATTQTLPQNNAAAGLPSPDRIVNNFVSAVHLEGGSLHIVFGNRVNNVIRGKILTLRPAVVEDAPIVPVTWVCGYAPAPGKMTFKSVNKTDIPANLLPLRCRAAESKS
jgi:type IV pilus assembly protein PilA